MTAIARLRRRDDDMMSEERELFEIVKKRSFLQGKFELASGAISDLYFNLKSTMMSARGAELWAKIFLSRIRESNAEYVGGLEMGAVPVLGSLVAISAVEGLPVKTFFVRKEAKKHGTQGLIEGLAPGETLSGKRVLIVDDVATSGGSIMDAVTPVRAAGAIVDTALVLVDREEGAVQRLAENGIRLQSVFRGGEFRKNSQAMN